MMSSSLQQHVITPIFAKPLAPVRQDETRVTKDRSQHSPFNLKEGEEAHGEEGGLSRSKPSNPFAALRPPSSEPPAAQLPTQPVELPPMPSLGGLGEPASEPTQEQEVEDDMLPTETVTAEEAEAAIAQAAINFGHGSRTTPAASVQPVQMGQEHVLSLDEISESDLIDDAATQVHEPLHQSGRHGFVEPPSTQSPGTPQVNFGQVPAPAPTPSLEQDTDATVDDISYGDIRSQLEMSGQGHLLEPEELDDDFQEQRTEVLESPFAQEALAPKLRVIDGPMQGQEFFISGLQASVGRGENNTTIVADLAMSRNHFELIRLPDSSFQIRDLGSANGTLLNGTRVQEASLFHGDILKAGKSTFTFENEQGPQGGQRHMLPWGNPAPQQHVGHAPNLVPSGAPQHTSGQSDERTHLVVVRLNRSTRLFTRISLAAGLLCIPLCVLLAVLSLSDSSATGSPEQATSSPAQAASAYMEGVEAFKNREWSAARTQFESALKADPTLDISSQLKRLEREEGAQKAYNSAKGALDEGKADKADAYLRSIPEESVYHADAQKLLRSDRRKTIQGLLESAQTHIGNEEPEKAKASLNELLELAPKHVEAKSMLENLNKPKVADATPKQEAPDPFKNDPPTPQNTTKKSSPSTKPSDPISSGYTAYKKRSWRSATNSFKRGGSKGKKLAALVQDLSTNWSEGEKAAKGGKWDLAVVKLEKAKKADAKIKKAHARKINKTLAKAYGKSGMSLLKRKSYRMARKRLLAGQRINRSESSLGELSNALERTAKSLYIRAAQLKRTQPDAAKKICRNIMLMTPSSSETNKKAKKILFEM